jgi:protein involved in polysaccharide export with SLBB domain
LPAQSLLKVSINVVNLHTTPTAYLRTPAKGVPAWLAWALAVSLGLHGANAMGQATTGMGGAASVGAAAAAAEAGNIEASLLSGNLGRSGEATSLTGSGATTGLASGVQQGVGGLTSGVGRSSINQVGQLGAGAQSQNQRADLGALPALVTTQFQRFVQDATGKALPLYGYNLFERSRFTSVNDVPVPANYVLGPGDEIDLKIWGAVDIGLRLPVDRQGQIVVPKVGPVTVTGVRASELDAHLKKQIGRVYSNFELSASVGKLRSIQIFVVGQARNPGAYTVSSLSTLVSAIFESGGPAATGSMRRIDLMRGNQKVASIDMYKFIQSGDAAADTRLLPGDVIVVPPAGPRVALTGAVDNQFIFELASEQESVSQILGYSNSSITLTTPHKVLVERVDNRQTKGPREVQERALDAAGLRSTVRDGDVITLFNVSPQFANAVTLRGNVASPLRYAYKPGMRVSDLIPEMDALIISDYYTRKNILVQYESGRGITADRSVAEARTRLSEINWDYASVERMDKGEIKTILIPFNLAKAVRQKDPANDLLLQPGDVVTIFGINDIPVPLEKRTQFVKVSGEVRVPGIYQITPGETIKDLIQRAGGLANNAYLFGTTFNRESTRVQQQANLDQAIRRMEAQMSAQASTALQNVTSTEANQNLQAQLAGQRMSLERLRSLRASGRIALELDPVAPELPNVALEEGDVISVPARPSFVSVFGAVLAESTFIHKPGHTVGDYLDRAGPTRDADLDAAMVIRSDGTVVANRALRSWVGWGNRSFLSTRVYPGDSVFVPELLDKRKPYTIFIQGAKDWTQLFYQFGLGAAAVRTLRN